MKVTAQYAGVFFGILVALWLALRAAGTGWAVLYALVLVVGTGFLLRKTK